jgi:nitrogen regulatory protein P-II 1
LDIPKGGVLRDGRARRERDAVEARGTRVHEAWRLFGLSVSSERELLLIPRETGKARAVLDAVVGAGRLDESPNGV